MKHGLCILFTLLLSLNFFAQTHTFKENNKWGIKESEVIIIPAVYDSIFNFDKSGNVCLACFKTQSTSKNKFIKVNSTNYYCNYLDKKSKRLILKDDRRDTCSVFHLGKNTVSQYNDNDTLFKVSMKNKKYLVRKNFRQLTHKDYYEIELCDDPNFYVTQNFNEADIAVTGLVTAKEELVIPYEYSGIKMNPVDSLIMVCGASIKTNSEDFVFDYTGKKLHAYHHHVDLATKHFIIFKLFEPKEHYVIHNIETKEDKELITEEVKFYKPDQILIRHKNVWSVYNLKTQEKTELKK